MPRKGHLDIRTGSGGETPLTNSTILTDVAEAPKVEAILGFIDISEGEGSTKAGFSPAEKLTEEPGLKVAIQSQRAIMAEHVGAVPLPPIMESKNVQGAINTFEGFVVGEPPKLGQAGFSDGWLIMSGIPDWGCLKLNDNSIQTRDPDLYNLTSPSNPAEVYPYYLQTPAVASDPVNLYQGADPLTDPMFNSCCFYGFKIGFGMGVGIGNAYAGGYPLRDGSLQRTDRLLPIFYSSPEIPCWQPCAISGTIYPADRGVLALLHFPPNCSSIEDFLNQDLLDRCVAAILLGQGIINEDFCSGRIDGTTGGIFDPGYVYNEYGTLVETTPLSFPGLATGQYGYWEICQGTNYDGQELPYPWNAGQHHLENLREPILGQVRLGSDTLPYGIPILGAGIEAYDGNVPSAGIPAFSSWHYIGNTLIIVEPSIMPDVEGLSVTPDWYRESNFFKYRLPVLSDYSLESGLPFTPKGISNGKTLETNRYFAPTLPYAMGMFTDPTYNNPWKWYEEFPNLSDPESIPVDYLPQAGYYPDFKQDNWNWQIARYRHNFFIKPNGVAVNDPPSTTAPNDIGTYWLVHFKTERSFEAFVADGDVSALENIYGAHLVGELPSTDENIVNQETGTYPTVRPPLGPAPDYGYEAPPYQTIRANIRVSTLEHQVINQSDFDSRTFAWEYNGVDATDGVMWCSGVAYFTPLKTSDATSFFYLSGIDIEIENAWLDSYRTSDNYLSGVAYNEAPAINSSPNPVFINLAPFSFDLTKDVVSYNTNLVPTYFQRKQHLELPFTSLGAFSETTAPVDADTAVFTFTTPDVITLTGDSATPSFSTDAKPRVFVRRPLEHYEWEKTVQPTESYSLTSVGGEEESIGDGSIGDPLYLYGQGLRLYWEETDNILFHSTTSPMADAAAPKYGNYSVTSTPPYRAYTNLLTPKKDTWESFLDETYRYQTYSLSWGGREYFGLTFYREGLTSFPVVMFGGRGPASIIYNDTWIWKDNVWSYTTQANPPTPREGLGMACVNYSSPKIVMFGGADKEHNLLNDTWGWTEAGGWIRENPNTVPPARVWHRLTSNPTVSSSDNMLMFGGRGETETLNDTWYWDNTHLNWYSWDDTHTGELKPVPRMNFGMTDIYDASSSPVRYYTLLFGGMAKDHGVLGDSWIFGVPEGEASYVWMQITPDNREGLISCLWDNKPFFFGGLDTNEEYRNDTWSYTNYWTKLYPDTQPIARAFHATALHSVANRVVIFGGENDTGILGDLWVWDGSDWSVGLTNPIDPSPVARKNSCMVYRTDHLGNNPEILLFGGQDSAGNALGDMWVLTHTAGPIFYWAWEEKTGDLPTARYGHSMTLRTDVSTNKTILLFGGRDDTGVITNSESTYQLDEGSYNWIQLNTDNAPIRYNHRATAKNNNTYLTPDIILISGGYDDDDVPYDDVWQWNGNGWDQINTFNTIKGRATHLFQHYKPNLNSELYVIFGGAGEHLSNKILLGETYNFNYSTNNYDALTILPRNGCAMGTIPDSNSRTAILQGGVDFNGYLNDTWMWDAYSERWLNKNETIATSRAGHSISYNYTGGLLFGGRSPSFLSDTWLWDIDETEWVFQDIVMDTYIKDIVGPGLPQEYTTGLAFPVRIGSYNYYDGASTSDIYKASACLSWMNLINRWEEELSSFDLQVAGLPDRNPMLDVWSKGPYPSVGLLKYPNTDYTTGYRPNLGNDNILQPDYSNNTGIRSHIRCVDVAFSYSDPAPAAPNTDWEKQHLYDPNVINRESFCLRFDGIQLEDFQSPHRFPMYSRDGNVNENGSKIAVLVKIPGKTNWMDAGLLLPSTQTPCYQTSYIADFSKNTTRLVPGGMTEFNIDAEPSIYLTNQDTILVKPSTNNTTETLEKLNKAVDFKGYVDNGSIKIIARHFLDSPYKFPSLVSDNVQNRTATKASWTFNIDIDPSLPIPATMGPLPIPLWSTIIPLGINHPIRYASKQNIVARIITDTAPYNYLYLTNWDLCTGLPPPVGDWIYIAVGNTGDIINSGSFQIEISVLDPSSQLDDSANIPLPITITESEVELDITVIKTTQNISKNDTVRDGSGCQIRSEKTFNAVDLESRMVYCQVEIDNHDANGNLALFEGHQHTIGTEIRHEVPLLVKIMMANDATGAQIPVGEYDLTKASDGTEEGPGTDSTKIRGITGIRVVHPVDVEEKEG